MGLLINTIYKAASVFKNKGKAVAKDSLNIVQENIKMENPISKKAAAAIKIRNIGVRNNWNKQIYSLQLKEPFFLTNGEYKFFSDELNNIRPNELNNSLEEILTLTDRYGSRLFVKELGHRRTFNTKALLKTKLQNPEHYYEILTLFRLHQEGKIKYIPRFIMPEGKLNLLVKKDMEAILNGSNYFEQFEQSTNHFEIFAKTQIGDAFSIADKMYVRTKTGFDELKINKKVYELLFPPVDRYAIAQGHSRNCGPLSVLNNLIQIPENRVKLYKLFGQKKDTIVVHTLGNIFKRSTFKLSELDNLDDGILSETCYALKMLEKHSNKDFDIAGYGLNKPDIKDRYFCKTLIAKSGTPFMSRSTLQYALLNHSDSEIEALKSKIRTVGHETTLVTGGGGSHELGSGRHHYISVYDCTNDIVKYCNPNGTAEYREMPIDEFVKKVYGAAFYHNI